MQWRDSLGETTKIPRLSTGSTRRFKSQRSQSSISSISEVFVAKKSLDGDEGRNAEAVAANVTATDPFEKGEQTLIQPDHRHHEDLEEPGDDFEREGIGKPQRTLERSEADEREELLFKGTSKLETKSNSRGKEQSSLVKQGKNATMSSINPIEEHPSSKARKSFKTLYDERMTSLRTDGLSSGFDHPVLMHSETDFTPSPRQEKSKKVMSNSPIKTDVRCDDDGNILDIRQADDVGGHTEWWCIIEHQAATSIDVIVSRSYPNVGNGQ